ncbi:hypothetical protein ACS0TY_018503 [Phlomoides rotata]
MNPADPDRAQPQSASPYRESSPCASRRPVAEDVLGEVLRIRRLGTSQQLKTISKEQFQLIYKVVQIKLECGGGLVAWTCV